MSAIDDGGGVVEVCAGEEPPDGWHGSIFLAGPTPRDPAVRSWRPDALALLRTHHTPGTTLVVFVPEHRPGHRRPGYDEQLEWEYRWLEAADVIAFWIPRDMATLPGLTTNVEFGRYENSGRTVLGAPPGAPNNDYLKRHAQRQDAPVLDTLPDTMKAAVDRVGTGEHRTGAHRLVPLVLYRTPTFRHWLATQERAGNRLTDGHPVHLTRLGPAVFLWLFRPEIQVRAEDRTKSTELVLSRPDLTSVIAYHPGPTPDDTEVVLVREFRSPSLTGTGQVLELPGGSSLHTEPLVQARAELREETGLDVAPERFRPVATRQPVATLSAHRQHVYAVELTSTEIENLRADPGPHGVPGETERTHVEIRTLSRIRTDPDVDWTTLGILSTLLRAEPSPSVPRKDHPAPPTSDTASSGHSPSLPHRAE